MLLRGLRSTPQGDVYCGQKALSPIYLSIYLSTCVHYTCTCMYLEMYVYVTCLRVPCRVGG